MIADYSGTVSPEHLTQDRRTDRHFMTADCEEVTITGDSSTRWVHKSVDVRSEVWRKLRVNAELSAVPVRDFLAYLIERSEAVKSEDEGVVLMLSKISAANRAAAGSPVCPPLC